MIRQRVQRSLPRMPARSRSPRPLPHTATPTSKSRQPISLITHNNMLSEADMKVKLGRLDLACVPNPFSTPRPPPCQSEFETLSSQQLKNKLHSKRVKLNRQLHL
jgi:hypothetical protein